MRSFLAYFLSCVLFVSINIWLAEKYNRPKTTVIVASLFVGWIVTIYLLLIGKDKKSDGKTKSESRSTFVGSVYVLKNPALSDVVKIGYTKRSAQKRARELSGTGVPGEWHVAYEIGTNRPKRVEKKVHRKFSHRKVRDGGEFFKVSPEKAARVIKNVAG
ncbi:GIY-YIG nuclease family protein [Salinibacter ruber]|uniref:GIY-YIG nuclease family protein n=1 Tax=Salinibacter ruber TaxID=146919 RepID=UPI002169A43C|nr:GIY-YIG nuclease family protein [Salinibacter ruber]